MPINAFPGGSVVPVLLMLSPLAVMAFGHGAQPPAKAAPPARAADCVRPFLPPM